MVGFHGPASRVGGRQVVDDNHWRLVGRQLMLLQRHLDLVQGVLKVKRGGRMITGNTRIRSPRGRTVSSRGTGRSGNHHRRVLCIEGPEKGSRRRTVMNSWLIP
jgi:hypothetical protein